MSESSYPHIDLAYMLEGDDQKLSQDFLDAGLEYGRTRELQEATYARSRTGEDFTTIHFGRNVLQALSYAEIGKQADEMRTEIEEIIALKGLGDIAVRSRAGLSIHGSLPNRD